MCFLPERRLCLGSGGRWRSPRSKTPVVLLCNPKPELDEQIMLLCLHGVINPSCGNGFIRMSTDDAHLCSILLVSRAQIQNRVWSFESGRSSCNPAFSGPSHQDWLLKHQREFYWRLQMACLFSFMQNEFLCVCLQRDMLQQCRNSASCWSRDALTLKIFIKRELEPTFLGGYVIEFPFNTVISRKCHGVGWNDWCSCVCVCVGSLILWCFSPACTLQASLTPL